MKNTYEYPNWNKIPHKAYLKNWRYKGRFVHNERKSYERDYPYGRPARSVANLPTTWNDIVPSRLNATSWKDKTKQRKQYQGDKNGKNKYQSRGYKSRR